MVNFFHHIVFKNIISKFILNFHSSRDILDRRPVLNFQAFLGLVASGDHIKLPQHGGVGGDLCTPSFLRHNCAAHPAAGPLFQWSLVI